MMHGSQRLGRTHCMIGNAFDSRRRVSNPGHGGGSGATEVGKAPVRDTTCLAQPKLGLVLT